MSTPLKTYTKDPDVVDFYGIEWEDRLATAETISTSTWAIEIAPDAGLVIDDDSVSGTQTVVWLSAGTLGQTYRVTNTITTSTGRTLEASLAIALAPTTVNLARLQDVKAELEIDHSAMDAVLLVLLDQATGLAEQLAGRPLRREVDRVEYPRPRNGGCVTLRLHLAPIESVSRVVQLYWHATAAEFAAATALTADDDYYIDDATMGVLRRINSAWYGGYDGWAGRMIQVTYTAGYTDPANPASGGPLPGADLQRGIVLQVAAAYNRLGKAGLDSVGAPGGGTSVLSAGPVPELQAACDALRRWTL